MQKAKLSAGALLSAALLLGGALGAVGHRWVASDACDRGFGRDRGSFVDWLSQELDLTADQREQVAAVLERQHRAMVALWKEVKPRSEEIRRATWQEVRSILTPEQRARHAELLERMERKPVKVRRRKDR